MAVTNHITFPGALKAGFLSGLSAAILNSALFFAFRHWGIFHDRIFIQPNTPLTLIPVVVASLLPSLVAGIVCYLWIKAFSQTMASFKIVCWVLLFLSFANPFLAIEHVPGLFAFGLDLMHIPVVLFLFFFLDRENQG